MKPKVTDLPLIKSESDLLRIAVSLGAKNVSGWSSTEEALTHRLSPVDQRLTRDFKSQIAAGADPLGTAFCILRSPETRREQGATYTPDAIVKSMVAWAADFGTPKRVVDPGVGSGRFLMAAGRKFPTAQLVGIDVDPIAAIVARANLAALGLADRTEIVLEDYCKVRLTPVKGKTLFIGNPPYVRHHQIAASSKKWLTDQAASLKLLASQLSGLHVYFALATTLKSHPGDFGCFITAAEWLDVNYGKLLRELFLGKLGGNRLTVIEPTANPFPDAASTGAITCFEASSRPKKIFVNRIDRLDDLGRLTGGVSIRRERFETESRWSHLTRRGPRTIPSGYVELGELCRVHRGQVTGANKTWIHGSHSEDLPKSVLYSSVTKARELFSAGMILRDTTALRKIIDLPIDLDMLSADEKKKVLKFLKKARESGTDKGYVASNRRAWWSVGLGAPAPILATYMARRPPAFVVNEGGARHINIAHGLYPREKLSSETLSALALYLSKSVSTDEGRTYAGGLTKFEPREMERLIVPGPSLLTAPA
jgi:hypothetical protein